MFTHSIFTNLSSSKLDHLSILDLLLRLYRTSDSSAPANESSSSKCAKDVAWKQALQRLLSMRFNESLKGLPNFHRNFAYAKFLQKGHCLKGQLKLALIRFCAREVAWRPAWTFD